MGAWRRFAAPLQPYLAILFELLLLVVLAAIMIAAVAWAFYVALPHPDYYDYWFSPAGLV